MANKKRKEKTQPSSVCRVNKNSNYTVMSNFHLRSRTLGLKAVGLLSKVLSLTDEWDYSIAGLASICKEGETAIKSALAELKDRGYLTVTKLKPNQTKSGRIEYVYDFYEYSAKDDPNSPEYDDGSDKKNDNIEKNGDSTGNVENSKKIYFQEAEKQGIENLPLEILPVEIQPTENQGQLNNNNKIPKKELLSNQITINQSFQPQTSNSQSFQHSGINPIDEIERIQSLKEKREETEYYIKYNIEYDWYESFFADIKDNSDERGKITYAATMSEIDMILEIIVNAICTEKKTIRIGKEDKCQSVVESRYKKLKMKHIEYALKCLMLNTKNIKNPISYLQTVLYNASFTCDFAESNELKNIDPALFIPEQFHNEEFKEKYYENTAFRPKKHNDW
ncbi:MAG: hypothetical protein K2N27_00515 [Ruminococcus sp.]|nr:hypothetical protein [Ruminococcus sp.]